VVFFRSSEILRFRLSGVAEIVRFWMCYHQLILPNSLLFNVEGLEVVAVFSVRPKSYDFGYWGSRGFFCALNSFKKCLTC